MQHELFALTSMQSRKNMTISTKYHEVRVTNDY